MSESRPGKSIHVYGGPGSGKMGTEIKLLCTGKMGFKALWLGFNHLERAKQFLKWEWSFSLFTIFDYRVSQKFVPLISCTITFDQNFIFK